LSAVLAVPVTQVPEEKKDAPAVVAEVKATEPVAAVPAPVAAVPAPVAETKAAPVAEVKAEAKVEEKVEAKAETKTEVKTEAAQPAASAEVKGQALTQIMKAFTDMSAPFKGEEFSMLKDVMEKGTEILAKAEQKAQEIHGHPDFQSLIQADSLFGIKNDGSIDADVATDQLSQLMSMFTGNQMSSQEKTLVHDLIGGFSSLFAPLQGGADSMNSDLEKLAQQFSSKFDKMQEKLSSTPKDKLLEPQTLLSVMSEEDGTVDTQLLSQVTEKFMDKITAQFDKVMGTVEQLQQQH